jgi:NitT/TauT family transport system permease protein
MTTSANRSRLLSIGRATLPVIFGLVLLAAWEGAVRIYQVPVYVVPGPVAILRAFTTDGADLLAGLLVTLKVTVAALVLAAFTGAVLAFVMAQSRWVEQTLFPYAVFLQVTPIVTIAPFIIIWVSNIFVVLLILAWMAALFPVISNTLLGLKSADPNLKDLFKLYRASRWQTARRLLAPSTLPYFLGGLRISGGLALIGTVTAEMVAGTSGTMSGLASRLMEASYRLELPRAMACFVLLSVAGLVLYLVLEAISRLLLRHWHESVRTKEG